MDWLAPMTGLLTAAVAVPALVLLYFLRLKRREVRVSSTLLWKRAVQDLRVNAPFQRLRRNLLLLLQLLALGAILVALARPVLSLSGGPARRYVLLIDQSASMNATDVAPSRLEEAKRQARLFVDSLRTKRSWYLADESDEAMVMAFGPAAKVLCNFTADREQLRAAIEAVEPTDGESRLADALRIAQAFATPAGAEDKGRSAVEPATLELFTDGRITDLDQVAAPARLLNYHRIGVEGRNAAVASMQARRSYERPDDLHVFATLVNFGPEPVTGDVQLATGADVRAVRTVTIPPATPAAPGQAARPGEAAVSLLVSNPEPGVLGLRFLHDDPAPADNVAWAILTPPARLRAALVTEGNPPLDLALRSCPIGRLDVMRPEEFDRTWGAETAPESPYGLVILDRHVPKALPRGTYLVFGPPPESSGVRAVGLLEKQAMVDWQDKHPLLNFVNLENIFAMKCWRLDVPRDAVVLAEFADSPALATTQRGGSAFIVAGFDVLQTNWPFDAGFVMFCHNLVTSVAAEAGDLGAGLLTVGQPLSVQGPAGRHEATVTGPSGAADAVTSDAAGLFRYARTSRAGVYRVAVEGGAETLFAVNLPAEHESDLAPADGLVCAGEVIEAQASEPAPANREFWPMLVALALAVVLLEWYVYTAKVRL